MLNICICDDDITHLRHTCGLINDCLTGRDAKTESFCSAEALLRQVKESSYYPDVAVLDIEMDNMDGIALARELNRLVPRCSVIFLTGHAEYCCEAYSTEHVFFVLKDRAKEYIGAALDKALVHLESHSADTISFNIRGSAVTLPRNNIIYIESSLRKLIVHGADARFEAYGKLDDLLTAAQGTDFVRCHQSYLVNLKYVIGIENNRFLLSSGDRIPISRSRFQDSKRVFLCRAIPKEEISSKA